MARDRIAAMRLRQRPVALIIRDGWGHNPHPEWNHANAIHLANTPVNDRLLNDFPWTQIRTSGEAAREGDSHHFRGGVGRGQSPFSGRRRTSPPKDAAGRLRAGADRQKTYLAVWIGPLGQG